MAREWGLARDEFAETDNIPEHMYVREARRIVGRYTFTENDNTLAPRLERAPIQRDSIAITEFPNEFAALHDRAANRHAARRSNLLDGNVASRSNPLPLDPARRHRQSDRAALRLRYSRRVGTFRQTPTQIQIGEAAACAAVMSLQLNTPPGKLDVRVVQDQLLQWGAMLSFFNDFDMATPAAWVPAIQFLGTCGWFASYDARPDDPLTKATAAIWIETASLLHDGCAFSPNDRARLLPADAVDQQDAPITLVDFMS